MTAEQFLQHQQEQARRAIARTWAHITAGLKEGADPVAWTREYPFTALGAAAVAGFVAAATLVPSKEQQALQKLAALERALTPAPAQTASEDVAPSDKPPQGRGVLASMVLEAIKTLQPVLVSLITAKVAAPQSQNGDPDCPEATPHRADLPPDHTA